MEIVSSIAGQQLIVTFRKNISGIIHRLGTLTLAQDEEQEVSLFAWAGSALESSASLEKEVLHLSHKYDEQGNMVKKLNAQLEDLIKAKQEHENALLEKFRELLNAKKLKIRDQQRLLAEAKVDPNKGTWTPFALPSLQSCDIDPSSADQVKASRSTGPSRTPKPSRTSKRKAATTTPPPASFDAEDTGFEAMTVDNNDQESDLAAEDQPGTPDKSDLDATEDEDDDLDPAPVPQPPKSGVGAKGKIIEGAENNAVEAEEPASPPPRRQLPFKPLEAPQPRPRADSSGKASQKDADDGGDTTSDDEL